MFPYLQEIRELEINIYYNKRGLLSQNVYRGIGNQRFHVL